jgi:hypothetical protein
MPDAPSSSSPRGQPAAEVALFAIGLAAAAALLFGIPYLPFQDLPSHALLLTYDRMLGPQGNAWLERPESVSFGYTMYVWVARFCAPVLSIDGVLRLLAVAAVLGLPLATARLAAVLGVPWALAGLLALPFALGWPLRMGLLSFVLGVPLALVSAACAVRACRASSARAVAGLAIASAAAYVTHAFAFGLALALVILVAATSEGRSWRGASRLALALLPAALLVAWDGAHGAWRPTAAASPISAPERAARFRPIGEALSHVACRTYGIPRPSSLPFYLPHLGVIVAGLMLLARGREAVPIDPGARRALLCGGTLLTLGTVLLPDSAGRAYLLGSRPAVAGMCVAAIAAAATLGARSARVRWTAAAAALLACAASGAGIARDARLVEAVVGPRPPRNVQGNVLVVRAGECRLGASSNWGAWDPLRMTWAYALSPAASAPYLFAEHRYDMVWFRPGALPMHPPAGRALSDERDLDPAACARRNHERLERTLRIPGYDGVIVVGTPDTGRRTLEESGVRDPIRLAPGMWLLSRPAAPERDRAAAPPRSGT